MAKTSWLDKPIKKFKGYRQVRRGPSSLPSTSVGAAIPKPPMEPPRPPKPPPPPPGPVASEQTKAPPAPIIKWIEEPCRVAEGNRIGQPFLLDEWQKAEIIRI